MHWKMRPRSIPVMNLKLRLESSPYNDNQAFAISPPLPIGPFGWYCLKANKELYFTVWYIIDPTNWTAREVR